MWNIPNQITLLRIGMIPVFVILYYLPWGWSHIASAAIFGLAALTDWVDGYLARKMSLETPFGAFLDPVADKLIVVVALIILLEVHSSIWFALPTLVIIGREVVISALREWMAERGLREEVQPGPVGVLERDAPPRPVGATKSLARGAKPDVPGVGRGLHRAGGRGRPLHPVQQRPGDLRVLPGLRRASEDEPHEVHRVAAVCVSVTTSCRV